MKRVLPIHGVPYYTEMEKSERSDDRMVSQKTNHNLMMTFGRVRVFLFCFSFPILVQPQPKDQKIRYYYCACFFRSGFVFAFLFFQKETSVHSFFRLQYYVVLVYFSGSSSSCPTTITDKRRSQW